jgi:hypothetical protein
MSGEPNWGPQAIAATNDDLSRRRLVTGAAVVAALGGATAEALAQGAPGGTPGNAVLEWITRAGEGGFTVETVRRPQDGDWT